MDLLLIGASHRTASVDVRGRLTTAASGTASWFARHGAAAGIGEVLALATCHRVEILALGSDVDRAERALRDDLLAAHPSALYVHRGLAAVEHLARVACGLDSVIVGEAEVSGQIRRAAQAGREAGMVGPVLGRVVAQVLRASGRARSTTRIGAGTVSAAGAAVSILEHAWGTLAGRSVLVVGAGEAARQALHRLRRRGAARLIVASRSMYHAREAAERFGAAVVALPEVGSELARVDGVIAAARVTVPMIDHAMCGAVPRPAPTKLQIVDLSVPRVVDPAVADLAHVRLHTVDDLGDVVRASLGRRTREIPHAERILTGEAARTYGRFVAGRDRARVAVA
jgi:glutamyl-tRNA reductase